MTNTFTQAEEFTVMHFCAHMRAGASVSRAISLTFDDEVLDTVAELKMNAATARKLAAALLKHADEVGA